MTHRSYSQVRQLRTCGEQYRLERIERVPSRPSVPAVAGVAIHVGTETIDNGLLAGVEPEDIAEFAQTATLVKLDAEVERYSQKGWKPETWKRFGRKTVEKPNAEDINWFREVGIPNSLNAYLAWRLGNPEFQIAEVPEFGPAIEVPFNYYIGGQLVHGWIDRIFTTKDGGYYPLDIKSGLKPKTSEQLGLYAGALKRALGWRIDYGYYLYGLKSGEAKLTPPLNLAAWTDELLGSIYIPANQQISAGIFLPNPGDACFVCSVSDHCAFVQALV